MCYSVQIAKLNQQIALRIYALLDFWILIAYPLNYEKSALFFSGIQSLSS